MPFYLEMSKNITQQRDIYFMIQLYLDSYKSSTNLHFSKF